MIRCILMHIGEELRHTTVQSFPSEISRILANDDFRAQGSRLRWKSIPEAVYQVFKVSCGGVEGHTEEIAIDPRGYSTNINQSLPWPQLVDASLSPMRKVSGCSPEPDREVGTQVPPAGINFASGAFWMSGLERRSAKRREIDLWQLSSTNLNRLRGNCRLSNQLQ